MRRIAGFVVVILLVFAGEAAELDLSGVWELSGKGEAGEPVECPITVPGDVHSALLAAGRMPDPFWGANETNVLWVGQREWTIARDFRVDDDLLAAKSVILRLEDVDTCCTLFVNGRRVGVTDNRFRRWEFDVKPFLHEGVNTLAGVFADAEERVRQLVAEHDEAWQWSDWLNGRVVGICHLRKPQCHAGWDWGISQMTVGFCGQVKLIADDWRIDYVYTQQHFNEDLTKCDLDVIVELTETDGSRSAVTNRLAFDNPRLWWPNGHGEACLTTWTVNVRGRPVSGRTGLRKIEFESEWDNDPTTGARGRSVLFRVNGRPVFAKGANWIPCDAFDARQTPERYRNLLESAKAANMNMIRLWGGGQFEKDCFYDLCDELGLLVWHDMMFACSNYPDDGAFFGNVRAEVRHQVRRLRNHASIALWCGDNECINSAMCAPAASLERDFYVAAYAKRRAMLKKEIRALDPERSFWPSSPSSGEGDFERRYRVSPGFGDVHCWNVWSRGLPFETFCTIRPRFCSEFGFQSFPSPEVAETFATREDVASHAVPFEWHQKNKGGNAIIRDAMRRMFKPPRNAAAELLLSQFQQGLAIKTAAESWRAQRPWCMGALIWQLNDNWPVASWSSIEYGGKWKPLHYLAKRFFAPLSVIAYPDVTDKTADVKKGRVFALNDTAETVGGELTLDYWTYDGTVVSSETKAVALPPDGATEVGAFAQRQGDAPAFLVMSLKTAKGTIRNDWHFDAFRNLPLAAAKVGVDVDGCTVRLKTDKPAFYVWANAYRVGGEFSDNCLTLLPGDSVELSFTPRAKGLVPTQFRQSLSVTHLAELDASE